MTFDPSDAPAAVEADRKHVWHHLAQHKPFADKPPLIVVEAHGLRIRDIGGREYLDTTSGAVWCVNVGYGQERIAKAVYEQLLAMPYYAAAAGNLPTIALSEKLVSLMPGLSRVYLSNSGSEANEKSYKMVRALAHLTGNTAKKKILYRERDYHGTTITALSSSGQPERHQWFGPFTPGFVSFPHACCYRCAFGKTYPSCDIDCARSAERVIIEQGPETVGGLIVESITAGGGIIAPVPEYYTVLSAICREYGVLLIFDEVVCGLGRTGAMFGYQHYGVTPDMVNMAKGLASAYMPISATVTSEEIFQAFVNDPEDRLAYFRDISTFGGSAAACAAALANIRIIEEDKLLDRVNAMGDHLSQALNELRGLPGVGDVRGKGLLWGVEMVADKASKKPLSEGQMLRIAGEMASADGVLVGRSNRSLPGMNNVLTLAPAYVVTREDIDLMVGSMARAIRKILG